MEQLKTKTTSELKVLAYDLNVAIQQYQHTLQTVINEINARSVEERSKSQTAVTEKSPD